MKKWGFPFVCVWLLVMVPLPAAANAAPGPDLTLVVMGGPEDLTVDIVKTDGVNQGRIHLEGAHPVGWERRYVVRYMYDWTIEPEAELDLTAADTILEVRGTGVHRDIPMDGIEYMGYSHLVTLDVGEGVVISGQPAWRQPLLVGIRVVFTLLVEGIVFYGFGYRRKRSWAVFILINILTQTGLGLLMAQAEFGIYLLGLLVYFVAEPVIFLTEAWVYALALREKTGKRGVGCALAANTASLFAGLLLFAFLPI